MFRFALICLVVAALASASAAMTLVKDGKSACTIVIAPDAGAQEKLAAAELQTYLRKMSGAEVPISTDATVASSRILLGIYGQAPVAGWKGKAPGRDAFAIETKSRKGGTDLYLVGGDARGAGYAAYELLERFLGVRWFMPGKLGEDVPQRQTVALKSIKWRNAPDYHDLISGLTWAGGPGADDWRRRNKGDAGPPGYSFGHNWSNIIAPTAENMKAHPEWFALQPDGTRAHQLCSSHPDVIRISVEKARAHFEKNPTAVLFSLSPNDGYEFCTCERCQAIDAQYGVTDGSQTDRFIHYANAVLAELHKTHPGKMVGILAYVTHTRAPVSAVPDPHYATMICHTPWEFCHVHALNDPKCERNARFCEMIEGWAKVCKHVIVYDYYGHFYIFAPWPIVQNISKDMPYMHRIGVRGFVSETQQHWATQGLNFYIAAKLAWDADRNTGDMLKEFYRRFYGPAEKPMRRYWETWEAAMAKQPCGGYAWLAMFTPELLAETGTLLDEAERLAATDETVKARIALHRIGYRFTDAFTRMRLHGAKEEWQQAVDAGNEAIKIVEESEGTEPQAFWIWLAVSQTKGQMKPYLDKLNIAAPPPAVPADPAKQ